MEDKFYTQSLNLAAYIKANGIDIISHDKQNKVTTFYFERNQKLQDVINAYNKDEKIKKFITCFKEIKELAHK